MVDPQDEYELIPEDEIKHLRTEVDELKHSYLSDGSTESATIIEAMDKLSANIHRLIGLFEDASKHITPDAVKDLKHEIHTMEHLSEQNNKIAKGILKVAGMVTEIKNGQEDLSTNVSNMQTSTVDNVALQQDVNSFGMNTNTGNPMQPAPMPGSQGNQQIPPLKPQVNTSFDQPNSNPFTHQTVGTPMPDKVSLGGQPVQQNIPTQQQEPNSMIGSLDDASHNTRAPHKETFEEFKARKLAEKKNK